MGSFQYFKTKRRCGKVDSPLNDKLKSVKWGEFKLGDLFEFEAIKQAKSQKEIPTDNTGNGVPYIVQSIHNNMFSRTVNKQWLIEHNEVPISGNRIVLGVTLPAVSYQPREFGASQVITAKADWLNEKNGIFVASAVSKLMYKFSYSQKPGMQIYKDMKIQLPIKSCKIDFDFMESFIAELEAERIAELEAYLATTGLKDYTLTAKEQHILEEFEQGKIQFDEFKVGTLFKIHSYKQRFDANKVLISENGYPYVVRTSLNNGIRGYIKEDEQFLNDGNTISFGQDTATMFYQEKPYFTGDKIKIIKSKDNRLNKLNALFLISTMTKSFSSFSWGSSSFSVNIIENQPMQLPFISHQPNYALMETFISAIQKLVIKDVVVYADKKIAATKQAISQ